MYREEMSAEQYTVSHWLRRNIWRHLRYDRHQKRFGKCASYLMGTRFIDVGCATGHGTNLMKTLKPGDWSGLDLSETAIQRARKFFPTGIRFYHSKDFNFLPVCGKFDSVVCTEVIEHVADDEGLARGLIGITKRLLVLTTPSRRVGDPGHVRLYNAQALAELFAPREGENHDVQVEHDHPFFYLILRK